MTRTVLLVDDDQALCETLAIGLSRRGYEAKISTSVDDGLALLDRHEVDVVVTDLEMRAKGGLELCAAVAASRRDVPVIVLTAFGSYEAAVGAIRAGAYDFMSKPVRLDILAVAIDRAFQHRTLHQEVRRLRTAVASRGVFDELIGTSPAMQRVCELLDRIRESDASVLVTGESGTGKEVVARAVHRTGPRRDKPFVAINCAAMPSSLLESELFGHARGAFTDAREARMGLFTQARGGTVFLDEIGDLPLELQPKLLRVLQERAVRPLGASAELPIDVRFIAATNRDLESAVEERRFREDLFFRINVIHVDLPPLRARAGDILPLAQHFVRQFGERSEKRVVGLAPAVAEALMSYSWPGNVRELQNCIERAVALARRDELTLDDLSDRVRRNEGPTMADPEELPTMEEVERLHVLRVLEAAGGNKTVAARILGFERKTLYRKLERYGVKPRSE